MSIYIKLNFLLEETNMFGNVYFANFFLLQGKARESWLKYIVPQELLVNVMKTYKMCTMKAEQEYKHEGLAFDDITVRLKSAVSNKELVLYFLFIFMKGDLILGYGKQKICFLNNKTNRFAKVPVELIDGMKKNIYYYLYQS